MRDKNKRLTELQEAQDTYSHRKNLVIRSMAECEAETEELCVESVRQVLINNLGIDENTINKMVIVRCHRIGTKDNSGLYNLLHTTIYLNPIIPYYIILYYKIYRTQILCYAQFL